MSIAQAEELVEADVRDLIRRSSIDPLVQQAEAKELIQQAIAEYERQMLRGIVPRLENADSLISSLFDKVCGFGEIQQYLDDSSVEEIWINAPDEIFVARAGESELTGLTLSEEQIRALVERMLKTSGRRLDLSTPFVDSSLPDGSRLHVAIPDVTRRHWAINIRKFIARATRLSDLVKLGSLSLDAAKFLDAAVASGLNCLVSGATQAGKTTMLNCLSASIGMRERVITCEEIFELKIPLRDVVNLQCRQPNLEGHGEIPLRRLVKEALRMRPDRLIIGEVREAESLDMLIALNSGLPGLCTIHANSARDAITKMCTLPLLAGDNISSSFVVPTVASCFDLVVHCDRNLRGKRQVREILAVGNRVENGVIETSTLFRREGDQLVCVASEVPSPEKFIRAGYAPETLLNCEGALA
ncbi:CpaF family protein [Rothia nasimurium]|uniref:CpaF family protein n=1 Tax=Rothia nasimurium TaxID=85336 RepID=UPI002DD68897|nr:ATPase, T2SS/T4P/T4SS family [Rothia nasimurium]